MTRPLKNALRGLLVTALICIIPVMMILVGMTAFSAGVRFGQYHWYDAAVYAWASLTGFAALLSSAWFTKKLYKKEILA